MGNQLTDDQIASQAEAMARDDLLAQQAEAEAHAQLASNPQAHAQLASNPQAQSSISVSTPQIQTPPESNGIEKTMAKVGLWLDKIRDWSRNAIKPEQAMPMSSAAGAKYGPMSPKAIGASALDIASLPFRGIKAGLDVATQPSGQSQDFGQRLAVTSNDPNATFLDRAIRDPSNVMMFGPSVGISKGLLGNIARIIPEVAGNMAIHQAEHVVADEPLNKDQALSDMGWGIGASMVPAAMGALRKGSSRQMIGNLGLKEVMKQEMPDANYAMDIITKKTPLRTEMKLPEQVRGMTPQGGAIEWRPDYTNPKGGVTEPINKLSARDILGGNYDAGKITISPKGDVAKFSTIKTAPEPSWWEKVQEQAAKFPGMAKGATRNSVVEETQKALDIVEGNKKQLIDNYLDKLPDTQTPIDDIFSKAQSDLSSDPKLTGDMQALSLQLRKARINHEAKYPSKDNPLAGKPVPGGSENGSNVLSYSELNDLKNSLGSQGRWMTTEQKGTQGAENVTAKERVYNALYDAAKNIMEDKASRAVPELGSLIQGLNHVEHRLIPVKQAYEYAIAKEATKAPLGIGEGGLGALGLLPGAIEMLARGPSVEKLAITGAMGLGGATISKGVRSQWGPKLTYELGNLGSIVPRQAVRSLTKASVEYLGNMSATQTATDKEVGETPLKKALK